jgi:hypothetical protein
MSIMAIAVFLLQKMIATVVAKTPLYQARQHAGRFGGGELPRETRKRPALTAGRCNT